MTNTSDKAVFELGLRQLWLLLGFFAITFGAQWYASSHGYTLLEPSVNPVRSDLVHSWFSRPQREDVLVIGSSRVAGGFDARIMNTALKRELGDGIELYKLGIAGLLPTYLADLLEDGVKLRPPKKLLVIAIEPRFFCHPVRVRGAAPAPSGVGEEDEDAEQGEIRGEWEAERVVAGFWKQFAGLESLGLLDWTMSDETKASAKFHQSQFGERYTVEERIQVEAQGMRIREGKRDNFDLPANMEWRWMTPSSPSQINWRRCLEILAELPCDVIFIRMPLQEGFIEKHMAAESQQFEQTIVADVKAAGYRYIDLSGRPYPTAPEHFESMTHLNRDGCVIASRVVVRDVLVPLLKAMESR